MFVKIANSPGKKDCIHNTI